VEDIGSVVELGAWILADREGSEATVISSHE
jgi:hypothetical protein